MGRKHQRTVELAAKAKAGAAASDEAVAAAARPQGGAPSGASEAALPFSSAALAARAAKGLPWLVAAFVDALRGGAGAGLGTASLARVSLASRALKAVAETLAAEWLQTALAHTSLLRDAPHPRDRPLLALSHLEGLAHSALLFGTARELLTCGARVSDRGPGRRPASSGGQHSAVLLEVAGGEEELCEVVVDLAFSDGAAADTSGRSSAVSRMASVLFLFHPPRGPWLPELRQALVCRSAECPGAMASGSLEMFLRGTRELLPTTRVGLRAAECLTDPEVLLSLQPQVLERLFYPPSQAKLALRLRFPVDGRFLRAEDAHQLEQVEESSNPALTPGTASVPSTTTKHLERQPDIKPGVSVGATEATEATEAGAPRLSSAADSLEGHPDLTRSVPGSRPGAERSAAPHPASTAESSEDQLDLTPGRLQPARAEAEVGKAAAEPPQPPEFWRTLRALEAETRPARAGPFELWVVEAGGRSYVLLLE